MTAPGTGPAVESVPVDVLDLVRQHAIMHTACVDLTNAGAEEPAKQHHKEEVALFGRIEAEVQRLRDRDALLTKWAKDYEWQRDEALAEVERLKAAASGRTTQVRNVHGLPWWIHTCGAAWPQSMSPNPDECLACPDKSGPWRPLLVAADTPQPDGPLVLTLPEVPEGAVALVGIESGRRYARGSDSSGGTIWAQGIIGGTLGEVLDGEPEGVRVETAPPREPRTWPKLDDAPGDLRAVRGASGRVYRPHDDGPDARWYYVDPVHGRMGFESFAEIAYQDGPLTEVLDA